MAGVRTRVIKHWDMRNAMWIFWVQRWGEHDASDLREAGRRPHPPFQQFDWRFVRPYPSFEEASATAQRIMEHGDACGVQGMDGANDYEVVMEYGTD